MTQNPKTLSWTNPITATNLAGLSVPWSAATDQAAVQLTFDGGSPVVVTVPPGATSLDLTTVPNYMALPNGAHTLTVSEVTSEGALGGASSAVSFLIATIPGAPTAVTLS